MQNLSYINDLVNDVKANRVINLLALHYIEKFEESSPTDLMSIEDLAQSGQLAMLLAIPKYQQAIESNDEVQPFDRFIYYDIVKAMHKCIADFTRQIRVPLRYVEGRQEWSTDKLLRLDDVFDEAEQISDTSLNAYESIEANEIATERTMRFESVMSNLNENEERVIQMKIFDDMKQTEIAEELGYSSRSAITNVIKRIQTKLHG